MLKFGSMENTMKQEKNQKEQKFMIGIQEKCSSQVVVY